MLNRLLVRCGDAPLVTALALVLAAGPALAQQQRIQVPDEPPKGEGNPVQRSASGTITVPLTGQGERRSFGSLSVTPGRLDNGLVEIGETTSATLSLEHTGGPSDAPIAIGAASIEGKDARDYAIDFAGGVTLNPGDVQPITITFAPSAPGEKSAALLLAAEGASAPYVAFLSATARYPLLSELRAGADDIAFGQVVAGATSTKTLTLANDGDVGAPVVFISELTLGGDNPEAFDAVFKPTSIGPGQSIEVPVTFDAATAGTKSATFEIVHDGNNPSIAVELRGESVAPNSVPVVFEASALDANVGIEDGTALQFGPDGRLYVAEVSGLIRVFDVVRKGENDYEATQAETISLIANVPNHDDDGSPNGSIKGRQVTGIHVVGTPASPVIWAASSDPRHGAGKSGLDTNLDTNSGILHKLTKGAGGWQMQDLVRGLPRSEENHTPNGLIATGDAVYLLTGGHTNAGLPSNNFAEISEYALSSALLKIDVGSIGTGTHDLPTLDDEDRPGVDDANDPFGGNDGKNQAKLVAGGPVTIHASGLRNAYDLVLTEAGHFYTFDNGPNSNWGGWPDDSCLNKLNDGGKNFQDTLELLSEGFYAGHPNLVRGNKANTFNASNPQSPVEIDADPRECQYKPPPNDGSLTSIGASTNGMVEYTASNFGSSMKGDLLAITFNNEIYRLELDGAGTGFESKSVLAGNIPGDGTLDVTALGDAGPFPGTVWAMNYFGQSQITVLEPADY